MNTIGDIIPASPPCLPDDDTPQHSSPSIVLNKDPTGQINIHSPTQDKDIDTSLLVEETQGFDIEDDMSASHLPSFRPRTPVKIHLPARRRVPSNAELIAASLGIQQRNAKAIVVDQHGLNTSYVCKNVLTLFFAIRYAVACFALLYFALFYVRFFRVLYLFTSVSFFYFCSLVALPLSICL